VDVEGQCVSEQPADPLPAREETTQFVVKSNQEVCVYVCWYDCIVDQIDFVLDCALRVPSTCPVQGDPGLVMGNQLWSLSHRGPKVI
jgi:hypothetical protein